MTETWAEQIERASEDQQRSMGFGPFFVHLRRLVTMPEVITRTTRTRPQDTSWPVSPSPGWLRHRIDDHWHIDAWCALGGEWIFRPPTAARRALHIPSTCSEERQRSIAQRLATPLDLLVRGDAFAFCDALFVLPAESFELNSFRYNVSNHDPLDVFIGYRGHAEPYPEVVTPGVFRVYNNPTDDVIKAYRRRSRIAANVVKQGVYEHHNIVLTNVQALGMLQHYAIIGSTDILDLSYDVNIAKWFALNIWDASAKTYRQKIFKEHDDRDKGHDECSPVYTVVVRALGSLADPDTAAYFTSVNGLALQPWTGVSHSSHSSSPMLLPPRNLSPLWSSRAKRQSGFGLYGLGVEEHDAWGAILSICEHRFHPTYSPHGWDQIGGRTLTLDGRTYDAEDDTSFLQSHTLPTDDDCIRWIRDRLMDLATRIAL